MKQFWNVSSALALACVVAASSSAQSLGEVARKEEARRKDIKRPAKVYTNDSLRDDGTTTVQTLAPPLPAGPQATAPSPSGVQPDKTAKPDEGKKDEAYWRDRIAQERQAFQRAEMFRDALQTRINSLTADFTARDDPAQRNVIAADRQKALAELDRVKREIEQHKKAMTDIEEEARKAGVPPGWLR
jgi:hypothetical protein